MDSRYLKLFFRVWIFRPVWKRRRRDLRKEFYSHFLRELQVLSQVLVSGGSVQVNISHFASNWMYLCLYPNRTESSCWFRFVFSRPELNWADIERSFGYPKNVTQKQLFHELFQKTEENLLRLKWKSMKSFSHQHQRQRCCETPQQYVLSYLFRNAVEFIIFIFLYVEWKLYFALGIRLVWGLQCFTLREDNKRSILQGGFWNSQRKRVFVNSNAIWQSKATRRS